MRRTDSALLEVLSFLSGPAIPPVPLCQDLFAQPPASSFLLLPIPWKKKLPTNWGRLSMVGRAQGPLWRADCRCSSVQIVRMTSGRWSWGETNHPSLWQASPAYLFSLDLSFSPERMDPSQHYPVDQALGRASRGKRHRGETALCLSWEEPAHEARAALAVWGEERLRIRLHDATWTWDHRAESGYAPVDTEYPSQVDSPRRCSTIGDSSVPASSVLSRPRPGTEMCR